MTNQTKTTIIESPCIRNCCLDNEDICLGCYRSLAEITQWALVDDETRQEFLKKVAKRKFQSQISLKQQS